MSTEPARTIEVVHDDSEWTSYDRTVNLTLEHNVYQTDVWRLTRGEAEALQAKLAAFLGQDKLVTAVPDRPSGIVLLYPDQAHLTVLLGEFPEGPERADLRQGLYEALEDI